jgi:hypothetical protein
MPFALLEQSLQNIHIFGRFRTLWSDSSVPHRLNAFGLGLCIFALDRVQRSIYYYPILFHLARNNKQWKDRGPRHIGKDGRAILKTIGHGAHQEARSCFFRVNRSSWTGNDFPVPDQTHRTVMIICGNIDDIHCINSCRYQLAFLVLSCLKWVSRPCCSRAY